MRSLVILSSIAFCCCIACEPAVIFKEAQPKGVKISQQFDKKYQGTYFCESDSAWVKVEPRLIYKEKTFTLITTREELVDDRHFHVEDDRAYIIPLDTYIELQDLAGDSVESIVTLRDTFFNLDQHGILKSYKGHQIMSSKFPSGHWQVEILTLDKEGNLSYKRTKEPEDLKALEAITDVTVIGNEGLTQYQLAPSRKEFKELLKIDLVFEECDYFYRALDKNVL